MASRKYALLFGLLGAAQIGLAASWGGWGWLWLWPAASFLWVAAGYGGLGPKVFGKRPDGRLAPWAVAPLLPFLLFTWGVWHLQRLVSREACHQEIAPGLWLGRRALRHELPEGIRLIVDLTGEFLALRDLPAGVRYVCLPTLDSCAPDRAAFLQTVALINETPGGVFVHCANGHGRSATLAVALLLSRGIAATPEEAEETIRRVRPGVRLHPAQRRLLGEVGEVGEVGKRENGTGRDS